MTEEEWRSAHGPYLPLEFVKHRNCQRQLRLFACACCRRIWPLIDLELFREAVEVAEQYTDKLTTEKARTSTDYRVLKWLRSDHQTQLHREGVYAAYRCLYKNIASHPDSHFAAVRAVIESASNTNVGAAEYSAQADLIRDIFGNPFRPVAADPAWLTPTVRFIAEAIYQDRAFDRLPILADALEEAGCTNADVLLHCREPGEHVRGCWVVDLVLGKG